VVRCIDLDVAAGRVDTSRIDIEVATGGAIGQQCIDRRAGSEADSALRPTELDAFAIAGIDQLAEAGGGIAAVIVT
jgi:hypothetical protein